MFTRIEEYFLSKPGRLIEIGKTLAYLGGTLIMFALMGNVEKSAIGILGGIGGRSSAEKSLAEIYPSLPTWWIPESIIGAIPAIMMILAGLILVQSGRRIKYLIRNIC